MRLPTIGPGAIVAAAFIGPGTVTTCLLAGVRFGYALLWALLFATLGTIVLQEMAARLGVVGGIGLGEGIRRRFAHPALRLAAVALVAVAIGLGNAAYETGNLLGAALGVQLLVGGDGQVHRWAAGLGGVAALLLWTGRYRTIERVLVALVLLMSAAFLATGIRAAGAAPELLAGLVVPRVPAGGALIALGLVGTTIVPYNLFLHASAARERFGEGRRLREARADLVVAIGLGGLVSMGVLVTGAAGYVAGGDSAALTTSAGEMAIRLEPLLGGWATTVFAIGLLAAGLTSAITAPLAAALALGGAFGWPADLRDRRLRATWLLVILTGVAFALAGTRPVAAIVVAQAANGLLLPLVAAFLLVVLNDPALVGDARNRRWSNTLGALVVLLTAVLGVRAVVGALS